MRLGLGGGVGVGCQDVKEECVFLGTSCCG